MSAIDEMYEMYGIEATIACATCPMFDIEAPECGYLNETGEHYKQYPPFTAEKQLELIEYIATKNPVVFGYIDYTKNNYWWLWTKDKKSSSFLYLKNNGKHTNLVGAIANLLIDCFKDFTVEQRDEVKKVLER